MIYMTFSAEAARARSSGQPLVALESTIITHGMPYPQNVAVALQVEADIREAGATPATIAVIEGRLHIGLEGELLQTLGKMTDVAKLSRADLAPCLASGGTGATTVAATMIAARHAGISVFATGGIGGVHRGAETSFDISADLQELAQTPVTVVSAGAKSILDIGKTLEVLETLGVPVIVPGQEVVPAFWSRRTPYAAPLRIDDAETIARAHAARKALGLPGGQLVANPIPAADEIPSEVMAPIIASAQMEAEEQGITGKAVTPFLLDRVFKATRGKSLRANIALVRNNAVLAAQIAQALRRIST